MGGPSRSNSRENEQGTLAAATPAVAAKDEARRVWLQNLLEHERDTMQAHLDQHYALVRKDIEVGYQTMFQKIAQQGAQDDKDDIVFIHNTTQKSGVVANMTLPTVALPIPDRNDMPPSPFSDEDATSLQKTDQKEMTQADTDGAAQRTDETPASRMSKKEQEKLKKTQTQLEVFIGIKQPESALDPNSCRGRMERIMTGRFDTVISMLIVANTLFTFLSLQLMGHTANESLGKPYTPWPGAAEAFEIVEFAFTGIFLLELLLRIYVYRLDFIYKFHNILDAIVVPLTCLDTFILTPLKSSSTNVSFVRLVRIVRVVRAVRMIRTMGYFKELRILLNTIVASCMAVCWGMLLLFIFQMMAAILLCQTLHDFIVDETAEFESREWINRKYGDGAKALWTVFEITFSGGWPGFVTPVIEKVSPLYALVFVPYVVVVVFAVIRIVSALFLKETLAQASQEAEQMVRERMKDIEHTLHKLNALFQAADTSGDGQLCMDELKALVEHDKVKLLLGKLGVDAGDSEALFHVLDDDGNGHIPREQFISGIKKVKGEARSMDLIPVANHTKHILKHVEAIQLLLQKDSKWKEHGINARQQPPRLVAETQDPRSSFLSAEVQQPVQSQEWFDVAM